MAQVLFFDVFSEKDLYLNAVEYFIRFSEKLLAEKKTFKIITQFIFLHTFH